MKMKKIAIGLVALVAFAVGVPSVKAWCCWRKCCCKCETYICCKPYNAFSPICCGNICCTGCCPFTCGPCPQPCCTPCCPPTCCDTLVSSNCCDSQPPHIPPAPYMPPAGPGFQPMPMPMPGPGPGPGWTPPAPNPMVSSMWNMPAVQQTSYYPPAYYPAYQPQGYWPVMPMAVPSYWYGR